MSALVTACVLAVLTTAPASAQPQPVPGNQKGCLQPPEGTATDVPWAQQLLAPQRVWPVSRGAGVTVAVVDTGVDGTVPQLAGGRVLPGIDVTTAQRGRADSDCYGHGTFLAGIIAARAVPGTAFAGVAPDATILPIRCATSVGDDGPGVLTPDRIAAGIRAGVDAGAKVVNVSASTTAPSEALAAAVDHAAAKDVVVVASASNNALEGDAKTYPAAYPGVIAVGAVDMSGQRASFSQTGPHLSLVAPGVDVVSTGPGGPGHWQGSGTSYAAPFVAGAAALVRAYRPELSAAQVKHRLEVTADHPSIVLPDTGLGWGTVNLMAAVTTVLPEEVPASRGAVVTPAPVAAPTEGTRDDVGAQLALGVAAVGAVLVLVVLLGARLVSAGRRRGWRRAAVVEVVSLDQDRPA
ncbi:type VII secretion-associated serine protease mycosin [Lentzea sp. NPDC059081]|uniref:type VII secretion-associated serine protease mycosin n=1 Tax=Lentzea sp. NPDC059081 TaxID=3346719 RepID=UPI0036A1D826